MPGATFVRKTSGGSTRSKQLSVESSASISNGVSSTAVRPESKAAAAPEGTPDDINSIGTERPYLRIPFNSSFPSGKLSERSVIRASGRSSLTIWRAETMSSATRTSYPAMLKDRRTIRWNEGSFSMSRMRNVGAVQLTDFNHILATATEKAVNIR